MAEWSRKLWPRASRRVHLLLATVLWTGVGVGLLTAGLVWVLGRPSAVVVGLLPLAVGAGWLKGRLVLAHAARERVARIESRGDGHFVLSFMSPGTWLMVVGMILLGRLLRGGVLPIEYVGLIYAAVGVGLLSTAPAFWRAWRGSAT